MENEERILRIGVTGKHINFYSRDFNSLEIIGLLYLAMQSQCDLQFRDLDNTITEKNKVIDLLRKELLLKEVTKKPSRKKAKG
jgi:hypothetical protein